MMRIEPSFFSVKSLLQEGRSFLLQESFASTITSGSDSCVCRYFAILRRTVSNLFRYFFSWCLPIEKRAPVAAQELKYVRTFSSDVWRIIISVHGVPSSNAIAFVKEKKNLRIIECLFPDSEMREHIPGMLGQIMKEEKAESFSTESLETAQLLRRCGFTSKGSIPLRTDSAFSLLERIKEWIARAEEKPLDVEALAALGRIKAQLEHDSMMDSFVGLFISVNSNFAHIKISDLFLLMEAVEPGEISRLTYNIPLFFTKSS